MSQSPRSHSDQHPVYRRYDPLNVACPRCGAVQGQTCINGRSGGIRSHDARVGEAIRQAILDAPPTEAL